MKESSRQYKFFMMKPSMPKFANAFPKSVGAWFQPAHFYETIPANITGKILGLESNERGGN